MRPPFIVLQAPGLDLLFRSELTTGKTLDILNELLGLFTPGFRFPELVGNLLRCESCLGHFLPAFLRDYNWYRFRGAGQDGIGRRDTGLEELCGLKGFSDILRKIKKMRNNLIKFAWISAS
jgi:hypothetical protein